MELKRLTLVKSPKTVPDLFNPISPAWNWLVAGKAKSGKSYLTQQMIIQEYMNPRDKSKPRPRTVIFTDKENAYDHLLSVCGGKKYIVDDRFRLNVFHLHCKDMIYEDPSLNLTKEQLAKDNKNQEDWKAILNQVQEMLFFDNAPEDSIDEPVERKINQFLRKELPTLSQAGYVNSIKIIKIFKMTVGQPKEHKINEILGMIESLTRTTFSSRETDALEKTIINCYANHYKNNKNQKFPKLSDFYKTLEQESPEHYKDVLKNLKHTLTYNEYVDEKFDTYKSKKFNDDIQVFVITNNEERNYEEANCFLIQNAVHNSFSNIYGRKIIVYDYVHRFLSPYDYQGKIDFMFMHDSIRNARKQNMAVIFIDRKLSYINDALKAVHANIQHRIFTGGDGSLLQSFVNLLPQMTQEQIAELNGLGLIEPFNKETNKLEDKKIKYIYSGTSFE